MLTNRSHFLPFVTLGIIYYMINDIESISFSLETEADLDLLIEEAGGKTAVLIGEATHGTHEFYQWRAQITKRLINEKGFSFVAVEGNWPECYRVNRYVKGDPLVRHARDALSVFTRWPTWIWANNEVEEFIEWLAAHNKDIAEEQRVGFYGIDVYSLWESLNVAVQYLERTIPDAAEIAREVYRCFEPYRHTVNSYPWTTESMPESCKDKVARLLSTLEHLPPIGATGEAEERFNAEQNALIALDAERYYRVMLEGDPESWNLREEHMAHTFFRLLNFYTRTAEAKGIIWAHNTHVGDMRATDRGEINEVSIGQLVRDALPVGETYLIGFGTYGGSVIAADDWNTPARKVTMPSAVYESWEGIFHELGQKNRIVLFPADKGGAQLLLERKGHRAVGVVYDPNAEFANYIQTILSDQYDAFLYIDKTSALRSLNIEPVSDGPPDTFPSAM
ncbi:MAG TPA: erythromycin esterase family protein [Anaerolineae bacterium]|jgi:erythromycin esterase-like protein|nr:erythromycin esterase family protein [Anaerolineae bacterium]